MTSTSDQIRAIATQAGIYYEAGDTVMVTIRKEQASELMTGIASNAIRDECRIAWARGIDAGRRAYLHLGNCEAFPETARPFNPSPAMKRAIQYGADLDRFYAREANAA